MSAEFSPQYLSTVRPEEVPRSAANVVYEHSDHVPAQRMIISAFRNIMRFDNKDGIVTYIAERERRDTDELGIHRESSMLTVDITTDGVIAGHGHAIKMYEGEAIEYVGNEPFVAYTETSEIMRRRGLGRRRLEVMNVAANMIHGEPLHSDIAIAREEDATSLWKSLQKDGRVVRYVDADRGDRFRFIQ